MEITTCQGLVINAPEFFEDEAFVAWLNNPEITKFTYHKQGAPSEWSDVVVLVDPGLSGAGADSDMPEHIWDQIVQACKSKFQPSMGTHHIQVRLTNLC